MDKRGSPNLFIRGIVSGRSQEARVSALSHVRFTACSLCSRYTYIMRQSCCGQEGSEATPSSWGCKQASFESGLSRVTSLVTSTVEAMAHSLCTASKFLKSQTNRTPTVVGSSRERGSALKAMQNEEHVGLRCTGHFRIPEQKC